MRELKFRAWVYYGERLRKPRYSDNDWLCRFFEDCREDDIDEYGEPQCIEQYTGLKDKNGKEIYEGDIIQKFEGGALCVVYWNDEELQWFIEEKLPDCPDGGLLYPLNVLGNDKVVIGNIHENPELLEGAK